MQHERENGESFTSATTEEVHDKDVRTFVTCEEDKEDRQELLRN